ncbi:hypothetical protein UNDYM_2295 [Undibacterium sp. YM2]|uniref:hypothetical protein n=1 Tax=Undibacterium sp. YM2 TaxID=2058625 RepID=UPI001331F79A|nr:hypothetical protein [Undibacterium sp. YM2]BBB66548.1 hypothetical protein UNDYM_2295 [Undibacterium sp. YM2]
MTLNFTHYRLKGKDNKTYLLSSALEGIQMLMTFMTKVIYGSDLFFTVFRTVAGGQKKTVSSLGRHMNRIHHYAELFSSEEKFSPLLAFFFEEYRKHPIKNHDFPRTGYYSEDITLFDNFVTTMRKNALTVKLKKYVADWESKSKKNI